MTEARRQDIVGIIEGEWPPVAAKVAGEPPLAGKFVSGILVNLAPVLEISITRLSFGTLGK